MHVRRGRHLQLHHRAVRPDDGQLDRRGSGGASQIVAPNRTGRSITRFGAYAAVTAFGGSGTKPADRSATEVTVNGVSPVSVSRAWT